MTETSKITEKDTSKEMELQGKNTKRLVDRINLAYYGMTWDEHERLHGNKGGDDGEE